MAGGLFAPFQPAPADAMPSHDSSVDQANGARQPVWLLRPNDQVAVAALVVVAGLVMGGWYGWHRIGDGRLVELDRATPGTVEYLVDVNQATWPELAQLPGIGENLARRIVESRRRQGPYRSVEDLERVRGIGSKTVRRLRPYLVEPSASVRPEVP